MITHTMKGGTEDNDQMHLKRMTLSFTGKDAALEQPFLDDYNHSSLGHIRFAVLMAAFLIGIFGILDAYLIPAQKTFPWIIRYAILCPGALILFVLSYHSRIPPFMHVFLTFMLVVTGMGFVAMVLHTSAPANYLYYTGLIQTLFFGYTFLKLRFIWGSLAGLIIIVIYEIAAIGYTDISPGILLNNAFFLISSNFIGMMASYSIEYYARRDFYLVNKLGEEQNKVTRANILLESRVQERTRELDSKNRELLKEIADRKRLEEEQLNLQRRLLQAQKMESLGVMAGGIAHDFNNILMGLLGNVEMAMKKLDPASPMQKYFDRMLQGSERARMLIRQILTFSRKGTSEREIIRTRSVLDETLKLISASIPGNIELHTDFSPEDLSIDADPTQMHQVLMNLFTNAIHAMEPEGGILTIQEKVVTVDHEALHDGAPDLSAGTYVVLSLSDTGRGIASEHLSRIFEPFFTTKEQGKGTGLGLSVTQGIVVNHEGNIFVRSEVGNGTTFDVYLPLVKNEASKEEECKTIAPQRASVGRVLLVDDQEPSLVMVREMLDELGYSVTVFTDPIAAEEAFSSMPAGFDILITDLTMPKRSGLELAAFCTSIRRDIPVLLITGYQRLNDTEELKRSGIREILPKPFRFEELTAALSRITVR